MGRMTQPGAPMSHRQFVERLIIALLVVGLALMLWEMRRLLILIFGAVLIAVIFRIIARPIQQRLHLPESLALLIAVLFVFALMGLAFWMFGAEVAAQADTLREAIPRAWEEVLGRLDAVGLGEPLRQWMEGLQSARGGVLSNLGGIVMSIGNGLTDTLLVLIGGIFLASNPELYRKGLLKLFPEGARDRMDQALEDSWRALRLWLLGRLAAMAVVGILTGVGLWLIGIPGALTLGILSGLLDFIPFVGPTVAAAPGILLALATDPTKALWVAGLYLLVQQLEGNVVTPLIQQKAVTLPPALLLFALVASGLLFGIVGILFAEPLTVVIYVMVKRLYVRDTLHTDTLIPGEEAD